MKTKTFILITLLFSAVFILPHIALAQSGSSLVPCTDSCDFNSFLTLINNLINFMITTLFIPIVVLLFMYAGFKYITAQGNPAKKANLKKMVGNIVIGMILVLCSWLIVKTVLSILLREDAGALQFLE
jgi:Type IV secretion system pilin